MPTADDHALAARRGRRGRELFSSRSAEAAEPSSAGRDSDDRLEIPEAERRSLGADGDRRAHELIMPLLAPGASRRRRPVRGRRPARRDRPELDAGHGARRIWIVDPLDGTREFSEGRADFAVHVALVENGRPRGRGRGPPR